MSDRVFDLSAASVKGPVRSVVSDLDWRIRDNAITLLLGPAGTGKSTILRALSGRRLSKGWAIGGRWWFREQDLADVWATGKPLRDVAWVPQIQHPPLEAAGEQLGLITSRLEAAFFCGAKTLLLDEPTSGLPVAEVERLASRLREHCRKGAAVIVSHDLGFGRLVADDVCLVCAGEVVTQGDARQFFERPPAGLAAQFLRAGSCAPPPPEPELPRHFHWLIPDRLAGMGRPGLLDEPDSDLFAIASRGVTLLVSLTEEPIPTPRLRPFGIAGRHLPIPDMGVPALNDAVELCRYIHRALDRHERVAVHCHAGLGRTGTILACVLVWGGERADDAIRRVQTSAPGSIQTRVQSDFVHRFAESVGGTSTG